jgi:hypothetical protein
MHSVLTIETTSLLTFSMPWINPLWSGFKLDKNEVINLKD